MTILDKPRLVTSIMLDGIDQIYTDLLVTRGLRLLSNMTMNL